MQASRNIHLVSLPQADSRHTNLQDEGGYVDTLPPSDLNNGLANSRFDPWYEQIDYHPSGDLNKPPDNPNSEPWYEPMDNKPPTDLRNRPANPNVNPDSPPIHEESQ